MGQESVLFGCEWRITEALPDKHWQAHTTRAESRTKPVKAFLLNSFLGFVAVILEPDFNLQEKLDQCQNSF